MDLFLKNNSKNSITLCVNYQMRTHFAFSPMSFLITYFYKASFYNSVIKEQWQRSNTKKRENR